MNLNLFIRVKHHRLRVLNNILRGPYESSQEKDNSLASHGVVKKAGAYCPGGGRAA